MGQGLGAADMDESRPPKSLDDLDARLREAKARRAGAKPASDSNERGRGLGFAVRIGVDIVAALVVGVGIGLLLDRWLGTTPWMLLLFFVLGSAAGLLNVYRVMAGYGYTAGYRQAAGRSPDRAGAPPEDKAPEAGDEGGRPPAAG